MSTGNRPITSHSDTPPPQHDSYSVSPTGQGSNEQGYDNVVLLHDHSNMPSLPITFSNVPSQVPADADLVGRGRSTGSGTWPRQPSTESQADLDVLQNVDDDTMIEHGRGSDASISRTPSEHSRRDSLSAAPPSETGIGDDGIDPLQQAALRGDHIELPDGVKVGASKWRARAATWTFGGGLLAGAVAAGVALGILMNPVTAGGVALVCAGAALGMAIGGLAGYGVGSAFSLTAGLGWAPTATGRRAELEEARTHFEEVYSSRLQGGVFTGPDNWATLSRRQWNNLLHIPGKEKTPEERRAMRRILIEAASADDASYARLSGLRDILIKHDQAGHLDHATFDRMNGGVLFINEGDIPDSGDRNLLTECMVLWAKTQNDERELLHSSIAFQSDLTQAVRSFGDDRRSRRAAIVALRDAMLPLARAEEPGAVAAMARCVEVTTLLARRQDPPAVTPVGDTVERLADRGVPGIHATMAAHDTEEWVDWLEQVGGTGTSRRQEAVREAMILGLAGASDSSLGPEFWVPWLKNGLENDTLDPRKLAADLLAASLPSKPADRESVAEVLFSAGMAAEDGDTVRFRDILPPDYNAAGHIGGATLFNWVAALTLPKQGVFEDPALRHAVRTAIVEKAIADGLGAVRPHLPGLLDWVRNAVTVTSAACVGHLDTMMWDHAHVAGSDQSDDETM